MVPSDLLSPGARTFHSPSKNLTFEYIIHTSQPDTPQHQQEQGQEQEEHHHHELIIIHPPAWGLGSGYLQIGLQPLFTSSSTLSSSSPNPNTNPQNNEHDPTTYTLLYFHPRNTGNTSRPPSQSQMSSFTLATDLEDLRIHLGLDKIPTLLGHSNGGAIALAYAEMYPHRVERLVLLDSQVIGFRGWIEKKRREIEIDKKRENEHEYERTTTETDTNTDPESEKWTTLLHDPRYTRLLSSSTQLNKSSDIAFTSSVHSMWAIYFSNPAQNIPTLLSSIGDTIFPVWSYEGVYGSDSIYEKTGEMIHRLADIQAKTLIIVGREDWICTVESAELLCGRIPRARVVVCEGCGHFPWIEAGMETGREIRGFIQEGT